MQRCYFIVSFGSNKGGICSYGDGVPERQREREGIFQSPFYVQTGLHAPVLPCFDCCPLRPGPRLVETDKHAESTIFKLWFALGSETTHRITCICISNRTRSGKESKVRIVVLSTINTKTFPEAQINILSTHFIDEGTSSLFLI